MTKADRPDLLTHLYTLLRFLGGIVRETFYGFRANTIPWVECFLWGTFANLFVIYDLDRKILHELELQSFYPHSFLMFLPYSLAVSFSGIMFWGIYRASLTVRLLKRLTNTFQSIGLKNSLGHLPGFVSDRPLDSHTRLMRLKRHNLPKSRFDEAKDAIEGSLQVYIDEIRENRETGTVDLIYAHKPMPSFVEMDNLSLQKDSLIVGATRSGSIEINLQDVPHLLVAGQTGGGKSTCMRQWITSLIVSNPKYKFTLIDLKGGLEFQTFEKIKHVTVVPDVEGAVRKLNNLATELEERKLILKENNCKDIDAFAKIQNDNRKEVAGIPLKPNFSRKIVVVDEIAELFLSNGSSNAKSIQAARESTSKIARQGRAVGLHLIVGTQRPDSRALDTQIKANLVGKICFQMADQHSSLVVLGNVRAKNLPPIAGRAIWQSGLKQIEVQMPYLSIEKTEALLAHLKTEEKDPKHASDFEA